MNSEHGDNDATQRRLDTIIRVMRRIQWDIVASGQPAAGYEIEELKRLGQEYAKLVSELNRPGDEGAQD
jgi:hypothetical protein